MRYAPPIAVFPDLIQAYDWISGPAKQMWPDRSFKVCTTESRYTFTVVDEQEDERLYQLKLAEKSCPIARKENDLAKQRRSAPYKRGANRSPANALGPPRGPNLATSLG